jgi:hypothetical protein
MCVCAFVCVHERVFVRAALSPLRSLRSCFCNVWALHLLQSGDNGSGLGDVILRHRDAVACPVPSGERDTRDNTETETEGQGGRGRKRERRERGHRQTERERERERERETENDRE